MAKAITWAALSALIALAGDAQLRSIESLPLPNGPYARSIRDSSELAVNTDGTVRYSTKKDEAEGLKDAWCLAATSKFEESWYYFPDRHEWVERGVNEKPLTGRNENGEYYLWMGVQTMPGEKAEAFRDNEHIVECHLHLEITKGMVADAFVNLLGVEKSKLRDAALAEIVTSYSRQSAVPTAIEDIGNMAIDTIGFYSLHPKGSFTSKIVSKHGVTEYRLTRRGLERFLKNPSELEGYIEEKVKENAALVEGTESFVNPEKLSDNYVSIKFTLVEESWECF